jgi:hypothetical protein
MIEVNEVLFSYDPRWMFLTEDTSDNGPAIYLTPLDWTQYESCRRMALVPDTGVVNLRAALAQLIKQTQPTKWRGFVRDGQAIPFDSELLLKIFCSNAELGVAFDNKLKEWAVKGEQQLSAAIKNSSAGRDGHSTAPGNKKTKGKTSASNA